MWKEQWAVETDEIPAWATHLCDHGQVIWFSLPRFLSSLTWGTSRIMRAFREMGNGPCAPCEHHLNGQHFIAFSLIRRSCCKQSPMTETSLHQTVFLADSREAGRGSGLRSVACSGWTQGEGWCSSSWSSRSPSTLEGFTHYTPPSVPSGGRMTSRPLSLFSSAPATIFKLNIVYLRKWILHIVLLRS